SFSASLDPNRSSVFNPVPVPFDRNDRQEFLMRSPLAYARSFKCPVRLYYGTGELSRGSDSQQTAERAKKAGLDVEVIRVSGNEVTSVRPAMKRCVAFFEE